MSMTNEEALMVLQDIFDGWSRRVPKNGSPAHKNLEALGVAIDALRDKWVRVEDGLPSGYVEGELGTAEPEEYIVQVGNAKSATVAMFDVSTKKFVPSIYSDTINFDGTVTHWQPLPEPPVATQNNESPRRAERRKGGI